MHDFVEAFKIFSKYAEDRNITSCEHDVLYVHVDAEQVSEKDKARLSELGFEVNEEFNNFESFRHGSC